MKKWIGIAGLGLAASTASAELLFYEGFAYDLDAQLGGQVNPFTNRAWIRFGAGSTDIRVIDPFESYCAVPPSTGRAVKLIGIGDRALNRVAVGVDGEGATLKFTEGELFYSLICQIMDIGDEATGGGFVAGFNNSNDLTSSSVTRAVGRFFIRKNPNNPETFNLGVRSDAAGGIQSPIVWDTVDYTPTPDHTFFIVVSYKFNPGVDDDVSSLWINPDPSTFAAAEPPPTDLTSTGRDAGPDPNGDPSVPAIQTFFLRQVNSVPDTILIDEIRIGTTWADVTPTAGETDTGACCLPDGSCSELNYATCLAEGGICRGTGSTCADVTCPPPVKDPFADRDEDGDVDLVDFAEFQRCYTGAGGTVSAPCLDFDRPEEGFPAGDGDVDAADLVRFIACQSGPEVPADETCDDE